MPADDTVIALSERRGLCLGCVERRLEELPDDARLEARIALAFLRGAKE
jgi:hypothetical protein